ncbi:MAG TPA: RNA methyltransferase, partial [Cytophagaceae bacterium]
MLEKQLLEHLLAFVTENKKNKMARALDSRTRHLSIIVEDVYQPHNASAVIRSCDCFGIQDLHIIENRNKYKLNPDVSLGSSKWVDIIRHNAGENNTLSCIKQLKEKGYKIIATTPHIRETPLESFDVSIKSAILLGNELEGLSQEAIDNADGYLTIPMVGFTESLNISVTAAICMHYLTLRL